MLLQKQAFFKFSRARKFDFLSCGDLGATHKAAISLAFGEKPGQQRAEAPRPVEPAAVNTAPALDWTGEDNYAAVGLSTG